MSSSSSSPGAAAGPGSGGLDRGLISVALVVVLGAIMSILDVTVVNVAINELTQEFKTELSTIQWVATGYTLALATVIPVSGWAADRFGTKRLYVISLFLFMGGSLASGLAWSAESLIAFRVLQGLGGGMIMPAGMTILARAAGPARMGRVMSIVGVPMLLGPVIGPILGGWLVDEVSWRWIFFINLPIGAIAIVAALRVLPRDRPQPQHSFDLLGLLLLSPGLASLIYGLAETHAAGGFGSPEVYGPVTVGLVLLALFVRHALRVDEPLIDLRLFANRTYAAACGMMILFTTSVFGGMLLLPLYFQTVRGESALQTGLLLAPQGLGAMLMMPIAGMLVDRTGVGRIVLVGMTLIMATFVALTQISADTSYWTFGVILFVMGLGMGATMMPVFSGAMQTLRRAAVARATTSLNIIQQVGASIGTAVLAVVLAGALTDRLPAGGGQPGQAVPDEVRVQVAPLMADAFGETFWWAVALLTLAFAVAFLLPRHRLEPVDDPDDPAGEADVPVLIHA
jgi:EmrB/QacA subfamily drug resistance transporter